MCAGSGGTARRHFLFMTALGDISMSRRETRSAAPTALVVARIGCGVNSQSQKDMHISAYLRVIFYNIAKIRRILCFGVVGHACQRLQKIENPLAQLRIGDREKSAVGLNILCGREEFDLKRKSGHHNFKSVVSATARTKNGRNPVDITHLDATLALSCQLFAGGGHTRLRRWRPA